MTYLLRITAKGALMRIAAGEGTELSAAQAAALLDTDVTERLVLPVQPPEWAEGRLLCYLIDARGGDKALPANFLGTCFYHTGCPIFGDLLLAQCSAESRSDAVCGMSGEEADALTAWLRAQFSAYIQ